MRKWRHRKIEETAKFTQLGSDEAELPNSGSLSEGLVLLTLGKDTSYW